MSNGAGKFSPFPKMHLYFYSRCNGYDMGKFMSKSRGSGDPPCVVNVKDQKVKGQGHKVTHKKFMQSSALALVTLESKRPLIVVVTK